MSSESRRVAGIILVVLPTVLYGGFSLLMFLIDPASGYMENPLRQNLFRAGHAHAGVLLVLSLFSWTIILSKFRQLLIARAATKKFLEAYASTREPLDIQRKAWPTEDYQLVRSLVDSPTPEDDLFAGVRETVGAGVGSSSQ